MTARNLLGIFLAALLLRASPAWAAPTVFDFEDRTTQGWSFGPTTLLVSTVGIFGEGPSIVVSGIDLSTMSIELDLTDVAAMTWQEFDPTRPAGPRDPEHSRFAFVAISPGETPPLDILTGTLLSLTNPGTRTFDLSPYLGVHTITIQWESLSVPAGDVPPLPQFPGYIDDIVLVPVPEPPALPMLSLAALGAACILHHRKGHQHEIHHCDRNSARTASCDCRAPFGPR